MKKFLILLFIFIPLVWVQAQNITADSTTANILARIADVPLADTTFSNSNSDVKSYLLKTMMGYVVADSSEANVISLKLQTTPLTDSISEMPAVMYARGKADALKYHKFKGAFWASTITSLFFPIGYVVPITIAITPPMINPAYIPDIDLLQQNKHYVRGYVKQAHKRKIGNAAAGAGIGSGVFILFALLLITASGPL